METILHIIDEHFEPMQLTKVLSTKVDWISALKKAADNRLLYCFSRSAYDKFTPIDPKVLNVLSMIIKEGNKWLERLHRTLTLLDYLWRQGFRFIIIKTLKFYQDVTFDVDILLREKAPELAKLFEEEGFRAHKITGGYELVPLSKEYLTVDLYEKFLFKGKPIAGTEFLWRKPRLYNFMENRCYIPNVDGEILLNISEINFQLHFLTLNDFLQITQTILRNENINWKPLLAEVTKHHWKRSFIETLSIIHGVYMQIYGRSLDIPVEPCRNLRCDFPYFFSSSRVLKCGLEILGSSYLKKPLFEEMQYLLYELITYYIRNRIPLYPDWVNLNHLLADYFKSSLSYTTIR